MRVFVLFCFVLSENMTLLLMLLMIVKTCRAGSARSIYLVCNLSGVFVFVGFLHTALCLSEDAPSGSFSDPS